MFGHNIFLKNENQIAEHSKNSIRKRPFSARKNAKVQKSARGIFGQKNAHMRIWVRADAFGNEFVFRRVKIPERDFHSASFFFTCRFYAFQFFFLRFKQIEKVEKRTRIWNENELDYWKISFFDQTFFLCRRPTLKGCRHFGRRPFFGRGHCAHAHFEGRKCRVRFFAFLHFPARKTAFFGSSFSGGFFCFSITLFQNRKKCTLDGTSKSKKVNAWFWFCKHMLVLTDQHVYTYL